MPAVGLGALSVAVCAWDLPGKNTGVGFHFHLQEIFPIQGLNPGLLHCSQTLYHLSDQGSQYIYLNLKMCALRGVVVEVSQNKTTKNLLRCLALPFVNNFSVAFDVI